MTALNLISDPWIPARARSGVVRLIRPAQIVDGLGTGDELVAPAWPRADFDVATFEFLIGLLFAAAPPRSERDWIACWHEPPSVTDLDAAFAPHAPAFALTGDGGCFLQDLEKFADDAPTPIERLLVDAAGESAVKKNQDVLVHRGRCAALDLPTAAMALYALQQFAPSGGAGNRTSMRGGGPLTVLAIPRVDDAPLLWATVWLNTPAGAPVDPCDPRAFPWMTRTRTSENDRPTLPDNGNRREDAHPAQMFFGMPRRLRLSFEGGAVTGFHQKPRGVKYQGWRHHLSPYYRQKADAELLPAHPRAGRFGYRDWVAAVAAGGEGMREAARAIDGAKGRLRNVGVDRARALIAGWSMNNMEAEDFLLALQPVHLSVDQAALDSLAREMAQAGEEAWRLTRGALRRALFSDGASVADDVALFEGARLGFFDRSEDAFHRILAAATADLDGDAPRREWLGELSRTAFSVFDEVALPALTDPAREGARVALARRGLKAVLDGRAKRNRVHDALGLDAPGPSDRTRKEARAS